MPIYTVDAYALATFEINAPDEAIMRKMLWANYGEEMCPPTDGVELISTTPDPLPFPVRLSSIGFRKIVAIPNVVHDDGTITDGGTEPTDGTVEDLEDIDEPEYCATEDCADTLDDGEGSDGYCGNCADRLANENDDEDRIATRDDDEGQDETCADENGYEKPPATAAEPPSPRPVTGMTSIKIGDRVTIGRGKTIWKATEYVGTALGFGEVVLESPGGAKRRVRTAGDLARLRRAAPPAQPASEAAAG